MRPRYKITAVWEEDIRADLPSSLLMVAYYGLLGKLTIMALARAGPSKGRGMRTSGSWGS